MNGLNSLKLQRHSFWTTDKFSYLMITGDVVKPNTIGKLIMEWRIWVIGDKTNLLFTSDFFHKFPQKKEK